jgi:hypothetical protein
MGNRPSAASIEASILSSSRILLRHCCEVVQKAASGAVAATANTTTKKRTKCGRKKKLRRGCVAIVSDNDATEETVSVLNCRYKIVSPLFSVVAGRDRTRK